jgi:hypothetical protein
MPFPSPRELKKTLIREGFEVYRTLEDRIVLADRVRDNLIMDSGVAAGTGDDLCVHVVLRAQASDYPGEGADALWNRARRLATSLTARGYTESGAKSVPIHDPGDSSQTLDTWYEISMKRSVPELSDLVVELRFALALDTTVPGPGG